MAPVGAANAGPAVDVRGVVKRYDRRTVLDHVDLSVMRGEVLALLGPNGAGKTTLVEIIEGYRRADEGSVQVLGRDPWRAGPAHRARVGLMLQEGGVDPRARPLELLRLYGAMYANPRDPEEVLGEVGLGGVSKTRYRRLSGGEKQRLGLGLALIGRPELLVLDEPTAGLDPVARAAARGVIEGLRSSGVTILLTTHDLSDVERLADRVAILDRGQLVALGRPEDLASGRPEIRIRLAAPVDEAALERLRGELAPVAPEVRVERGATGAGQALRIVGREPSAELIAAVATACARAGLMLTDLNAGGASLEARYLALVGRSARTDDGGPPGRGRSAEVP